MTSDIQLYDAFNRLRVKGSGEDDTIFWDTLEQALERSELPFALAQVKALVEVGDWGRVGERLSYLEGVITRFEKQKLGRRDVSSVNLLACLREFSSNSLPHHTPLGEMAIRNINVYLAVMDIERWRGQWVVCGGKTRRCGACEFRYRKELADVWICPECGVGRKMCANYRGVPSSGNGRCDKHGGMAAKGIAHPNFEGGHPKTNKRRYSILNPTLQDVYEEFMHREDSLSLREELGVLTAIGDDNTRNWGRMSIEQILDVIDALAGRLYDALERDEGLADTVESVLDDLDALFNISQEKEDSERRVIGAFDAKARLVRTEIERMKVAKEFIPIDILFNTLNQQARRFLIHMAREFGKDNPQSLAVRASVVEDLQSISTMRLLNDA